MRVALRFIVFVVLAMVVITTLNALSRINRDTRALRNDTVHDHEIIGRTLRASYLDLRASDGPARADAMIHVANSGDPRVTVRLVRFDGLAPHVPRLHMVTGAWLADPPPGIPQPPRRDRWRALFDAAGVALVNAEDGGGERIRALLAGGQVVAITFDWPGSVETPFLGRPTWLASGSARLAADTGALIVPAMRRWRRLRPQTVVAPPLDPRDHADWRALHERLAAVHSHWIAQRPAALEDPRRPGAWEATATADAWGPLPHRQS